MSILMYRRRFNAGNIPAEEKDYTRSRRGGIGGCFVMPL